MRALFLLALGAFCLVGTEAQKQKFIYYPKELEKYINDPSKIAEYLLEHPEVGRFDPEALFGQSLARTNVGSVKTLPEFVKSVANPEDIIENIKPDPMLPLLTEEKLKRIFPPSHHAYATKEMISKFAQNKKIPELNNILNDRMGSPAECPVIEAKENCPEVEPTRTPCWSPGAHDVDCPNGDGTAFGLCCFDGCHNTCLQKECKVINTTYHEMETQEQCTDAEREECEKVPEQFCKEVCKDETVMETQEVPEEKCETVEVQECRTVTVEEEKCTEVEEPPISYVNYCPPPPENPACDPSKPVNECWSPGVPDVDCPRPLGPGNWTDDMLYAPCCFNGCSNVCYDVGPISPCPTRKGPKNCRTRNECKMEPKECGTMTKCEMVTKTCETPKMTKQCTMQTQQVCKPVMVQKPVEVLKPVEPVKPVTTYVPDGPTPYNPGSHPVHPAYPGPTAYPGETYIQPSQSTWQLPGIGVQQPYMVNGGHKAKGHQKSKGFKSKGMKSKGIHGLGKRSVSDTPASKKGDDGDLVLSLIKSRAKRSHHKKGKGGKGMGYGMQQAYAPQPAYSYGQQPVQSWSQPISTDYIPGPSSQPISAEDVPGPSPVVPGNFQWNFTGTWNPTVQEPLTVEQTLCHDEQVEVCEDVEDENQMCEHEVCEEIVEEDCDTEEEICDEVLECEETYVPVCTVCEKVPKEVEECRTKPEKQCATTVNVIEVPKTVTKCEDVCEDQLVDHCKMVPYQECHPVELQVEKVMPEEVCEWPTDSIVN